MTTVTQFILLGFPLFPHLSVFFFCLVLLSYLLTMAGNFLILTLVFFDRRFHRPMYFFLCNLSIMDICFTNTIVPNMLRGFLVDGKSISLTSCFTQSYIFFLVGTAEFQLLAVMSYDRYVAICHPLGYTAIMHRRVYLQLIAGVWLGSFFSILAPSTFIMRLPFCFDVMDHFFCDVGPLLRNSCIDTTAIQMLVFATSSPLLFSFLITCVSYSIIILAILKIKSVEGRGKAFSTCSSHGIVVILAYGSCIFMYSRPMLGQRFEFDKLVSVLNTVVVPLIHPFIYTLRNQNVKEILKDRMFSCGKMLQYNGHITV
ncbi:olfactory receptor 6M1-like [Ascaphus truei]|uniref:olfactory receptor 6M1-like n=1 Tax=Ascaphus truei TaxID=8439 RepID=UPI003F596042